MIQPSQRLDEDVGALVAELVPPSDEEVQSLLEVEVEMPVEVAARELVNLLLRHGMKILELVERRELLHVQSVGCDDVGLALQQMFRFVAGDF